MFLSKCFSVALVFMAFGMMNCDNEQGFIDSDTEEPGDQSEQEDSGDPPEPEDYRFQYLFECRSDVAVPADVVQYKNYAGGYEAKMFNNAVGTLVDKWFDESCLEECEVIPPATECQEADCVTDAGATLVYNYTVIVEDDYAGYPSHTTTLENLTIIPPEGAETWQKITMEQEGFVGEDFCGDSRLAAYSIQWDGELFADLPSDYAVESIVTFDMSECGSTRRNLDWKHENCDLVVDHLSLIVEECSDGPFDYTITVNKNKVVVTNRDSEDEDVWKGTVNGEYVGIVHSNTWHIIGE